MKVRADFVTNSSSSSYCAITIDDGKNHRFEFGYQGFWTFQFADPKKKLSKCKSKNDLEKAIIFAVGGDGVPKDHLKLELEKLGDFSEIKSIEIMCHEEIADPSEDDGGPADVWFSYDFETGKSLVSREEYDYDE